MKPETLTKLGKAILQCAAVAGFVAASSVAAMASEDDARAASLLSQRKPAALPPSPYSFNLLLGEAFRPDDLTAMLNSSGSAACFTNSDKLEKSDAGGRTSSRACVAAVEQTYYERIAFANDRFTQGLMPSYAPNAIDSNFILKGAMERMSSRLATRAVSRNELLKVLVEGKIDVNFSFRDLGSVSEKFERAPVARPSYVLAVKYREGRRSEDLKVAAVGNSALSSLKPASQGLRDLPVAEKQIVETWPNAIPVAALTPVVDPSAETRFTRILQKRLGLASEPFSQFRLRVEHAPNSLSLKAFALRLEDASGLSSFDLTGLVQGNPEGIAYKLRLPYRRHSALASADNLAMKTRYIYEYEVMQNMRTRVAYDPNTPEGAVPNSWAGKYSVGLSWAL